MNLPPHDPERPASLTFQMLEWATAAVLTLVVIALGWVLLVTYWPERGRFGSDEVEVIALLILLAAALMLVSGAALIHTRK